MEASHADYETAVSAAQTIVDDYRNETPQMVFSAARALLDESQGEEMRVSNAEGYIQHSTVRYNSASFDTQIGDDDLKTLITEFSDALRTLSA